MSLSHSIEQQSYTAITSAFTRKHPLTTKAKLLLEKVHHRLSTKDIAASMQSAQFIQTLVSLVHHQQSQKDLNKTAQTIIQQLYRIHAEESRLLHVSHIRAGHFDETALHERALKDEMQDHDMIRFMPKSHGTIEILAPIHQTDVASIAAVQEGVRAALTDHSKQHLCFAMGPGHWRGVYISKPQRADGPYQVEIFDPYGPEGATRIESQVKHILASVGLTADKCIIQRSGPPISQKDGYACGDFTCAYSHKKMREFGAPQEHYNKALITVIEHSGNQDNLLRETTRALSAGRPVPTRALERPLTKQELDVVEKTTEKSPTTVYKNLIQDLIRTRDSIFTTANSANQKESQGRDLSDEELAAKLQAQEFENVGLKPK